MTNPQADTSGPSPSGNVDDATKTASQPAASTPAAQSNAKKAAKRHRVFSFPPSFWLEQSASASNTPSTSSSSLPAPNHTNTLRHGDSQQQNNLDSQPALLLPGTVSIHPTCSVCGLTFANFEEQRAHFRTDWHKCNVKRHARHRPSLTLDEFENLSDLGSHSSLSGSDNETSDSETEDQTAENTHNNNISDTNNENVSNSTTAAATIVVSERIEFFVPSAAHHVLLYKAVLPDLQTLGSLSARGPWAIIMTGGGHFCAAVWDVTGKLDRHKTFHRYTSRRKQGGSQAVADAARGAANRIRSAGATLRRYGEQALQNEVHALLKAWAPILADVQCVFIRASARDKRELVYGWSDSPVHPLAQQGRVRNIPFPTRRPTLKEATRVYDELSTVTLSDTSVLAAEVATAAQNKRPAKQDASANNKSKAAHADREREKEKDKEKEKGTDHLKKRDDEEKLRRKREAEAQAEAEAEAQRLKEEEDARRKREEDEKPLDEATNRLLNLVLDGDRPALSAALSVDNAAAGTVFQPRYLRPHGISVPMPKPDGGFGDAGPLGMAGVAAHRNDTDLVVWLLDAGVPPAPSQPCVPLYNATKAKPVRTALRTYWAQHPDRYDYEAAGVPSPLSTEELDQQRARGKQKKKKDKAKKKDKELQKLEAAKTPAEKARELRLAAAEARQLGNRCANCKKELNPEDVPFSRLSYKYCKIECVTEHRKALLKG